MLLQQLDFNQYANADSAGAQNLWKGRINGAAKALDPLATSNYRIQF